jgi:hypothetical protein
MIRKILLLLIASALFYSCGDNKTTVSNTDIDVARAFIKDILSNNLKEADNYILKDETNKEYFDLIERKYKTMPKDELENYKNADIIVNEISNVSDSVTIVNYSNSYKKEANKVKMVRINGQWLVDLKYTFSGNL